MKNMDSYGHYTERGTYVIDTPTTPTRWENFLFNDNFVMKLSQRMTGTSYRTKVFAEHPVIEDRSFYLRANGQAAQLFCGQGKDYQMEYDLPSSCGRETVGAVRAEILAFVPTEGLRECWQMSLTNTGDKATDADFFCLFRFSELGTMGGTSRLEDDGKTFVKYAFPYHVYYEDMEDAAKNYPYGYVISDRAATSWAGSQLFFIGHENPQALPHPVVSGQLPDKMGAGKGLVAGYHFHVTLAPGQTETIRMIASCAVKREEIDAAAANFPDFEKEYAQVCKLWDDRCVSFTIQTPYTELNYMMNRWFKKQATYLSRMNRGTVYAPIRNQLQDTLGYAMVEPEEAYKVIWNVMKRQTADGNIKQWNMADDSAPRGLCLLEHSDGPIWLILCFVEIINATGDIRHFDDTMPYADTGKDATVLEHLKAAARYMFKEIGAHGLCLMKDGDWTDPINGPGRKGRGESVWDSMALIFAVRELTAIFPDEELTKAADAMADNLNKYAWDGAWYVAGFDDDGKPYGTHTDKESRIFLNTQSWAFIADIVPENRRATLCESLELLHVPFGYLLNDPAFSAWNATWGRVSVKQAGTTENGSVYCHGSMFKALGDCIRGDRTAAWDVVCATLPTNPENPTDHNLQMPTFVPNYYFGQKGDNFGVSSNNPGTGTNAWMLWVVLEFILGVRCTVKGVTLAKEGVPKIGPYTVRRRFAGKEITLEMK